MRAERPSTTARLIAAATVFLSRDPRFSDLVPPGAAELCARFVSVEAVSRPPLSWAVWLAERATIPGLMLHFILRKRFIEDAVRASLAAGIQQVVVIGAGFDTLAARLAPEFPQAQFIEVDHAATQRAKRQAIDSGRNLHFVAADLTRVRLPDALAGGAYRFDASSVFVVEGLLMYLTDAEITALFAAIAELQRTSGTVIFSVMEPAADGHPRFHNATPLVTRLLSLWSEPFRSAMRREAMARLPERFPGFRLRETAAADEFRSRYLAPSGRQHMTLARGETVLVAERIP
ncbi:MAG TPA: class I SAM-dependent methyltransferase [Burkholderiales bacterium]|nr:class I SAM-dependent methyltransferase [Burkholderiales bacterium]